MKKILALIVLPLVVAESSAQGLNLQLSYNYILCGGDATGSVTADPTGGVSPYAYAWDNGRTTQSITGLSAGTYCVTVTDSVGTSDSICGTLTEPSPISLTTSSIDDPCGGCDGRIDMTLTGGAAPYTYTWSNGSNSYGATGLCPGIYTVTLTDMNVCTATATDTIGAVQGLSFSFSKTDATSCSSCDGTATVNITGGTAPFSFLWEDGGTAANASALCFGTYTVTVSDSTGCQITDSVVIYNGSFRTSVTKSDVTVCNTCNGWAKAGIDLGSGPFTYFWTTGATTDSISGLCQKKYRVTVTDGIGCESIHVVNIADTTGVYGTVSAQNTKCYTECAGSVSATAFGGTPPYTFLWSNGSTASSVSNLCYGSYFVTITDGAGCLWSRAAYVSQNLHLCDPGVIAGRIYIDVDSNCLYSSPPDRPLWGQRVVTDNPNPVYGNGSYTDTYGTFRLLVDSGLHNLTHLADTRTVAIALLDTACASPANFRNILNLNDTVTGRDLIYKITDYCPVLHYPVSSWARARRCFDNNYTFFVCNIGTDTARNVKATVYFDPIQQPVASNHPVDSSQSGVWIIDAGNLPPGMCETIVITYKIACSAAIDQKMCFRIEQGPVTLCRGKSNLGYDTSYTVCGTVIASYDPNDKAIIYPEPDSTAFVDNGDTLIYHINFQNTGNDTAFNIVVRDRLAASLRQETFLPGGASHPYDVELYHDGWVEWTFRNILLPDSTTDEPGSHGYVGFSVVLAPGLPPGAVIDNTAEIYFDFNEPIYTNTATAIIRIPDGIEEKRRASGLLVYPNPFTSETVLRLRQGTEDVMHSIRVYDVAGREVFRDDEPGRGRYVLSRKAMESGIYFVNVTTSHGAIYIEKIIVR